MSAILIILIFMLILQIIAYFSFKNTNYCDNLTELIDLNFKSNIKTSYLPLQKTNLHIETLKALNLTKKHLNASLTYIHNQKFLTTLAKFIDYKINNNKNLYRSKQEISIIENYAYLIAKTIHKPQNYKLFYTHKMSYKKLQLKQKEHKIFKIVLAKYLIIEANKIFNELNQISNVIQKYKKRNYVSNCKKNILNSAKIYSILKFNQNSTYLISRYKINTDGVLNSFFCELFDTEQKLQTIIAYLKVMFDF